MIEKLSHFPVNWIDGMKINKSHFLSIQDNVSELVNDAIGQASKSAKEVSGAILDQGLKALKSTFDIIGAWLKGEKTTAQAMTGIKGAWKEAGKEVSKSFSEAKKSFVDKNTSLASTVKQWQMSMGRFLISV